MGDPWKWRRNEICRLGHPQAGVPKMEEEERAKIEVEIFYFDRGVFRYSKLKRIRHSRSVFRRIRIKPK